MATEALEKIAELGNVKFLELGSLVIKERNGSYTEKYRCRTSSEYTSVWVSLPVLVEITSER